jgi:hypothetical protein
MLFLVVFAALTALALAAAAVWLRHVLRDRHGVSEVPSGPALLAAFVAACVAAVMIGRG